MAWQPPKIAAHPCAAETLVNQSFPNFFSTELSLLKRKAIPHTKARQAFTYPENCFYDHDQQYKY